MNAAIEKKLRQLAKKELQRLDPPAREYDDEFETEADEFYRSLAYDD